MLRLISWKRQINEDKNITDKRLQWKTEDINIMHKQKEHWANYSIFKPSVTWDYIYVQLH